MFTAQDSEQMSAKGINKATVEAQIENFKNGFAPANIVAAATVGNGIIQLTDEALQQYSKLYNKATETEKIVKFVPASGAASRMFKSLFSFMDKYDGNDLYLQDESFGSLHHFFEEINGFAFYDELEEVLKDFEPGHPENLVKTVEGLLLETGMNYAQKPKGLLKFHKYGKDTRTAAEEHLAEGALYANSNGVANIHFTVSPNHRKSFEEHIANVLPKHEKLFNIKYNVTFSEQKQETDTIAVNLDNSPFRNEDGSILYRPGGHGALIENLKDIDADIIFVKNIDNVVPDKHKEDTILYKKALAGLLLETRDNINYYLENLVSNQEPEIIVEATNFLRNSLSIDTDDAFDTKSDADKRAYLLTLLDRPLRICGMVKNEGEPGGGPFFVKDENGLTSLQIIEGAQIDMDNPEKAKIVENATHFNPVDLICSLKQKDSGHYNVRNFIDEKMGFISEKSKDGKQLKAQELPGLWNGAMANWNTIFAEVPISTFNPVKTISDLLRPMHK